jgi:CubicO group peptidase (beta-lactamase class C family)
MTIDSLHWQQRLDELADRHGVPGASLAVLDAGEVSAAATGVVNKETGVQTTTDAVFQIGSITKVWTTTLIMQLAEQGKLDLDASLAGVLPELKLATPGATAEITVRHLLTHSSGIDGDLFEDGGRGSDRIARYVANCAKLTLTHPVGSTVSYCNAGFSIAGRIVEVVSGQVWDEALRRNLVEPLDLTHTVTLAEEAIRFRAAYGHLDHDGEQRLAPMWALPGGAGPAGGVVATASDVIEFAQLHLRDGRTADGRQLLPSAAVKAMQQPQVEVPDPDVSAWGLGWTLFDWDGQRVFGHDGGTIGQSAFLRVLPGAGGAVCLLTNGGQASKLYRDLFEEIFATLWQVRMPAPAAPAAQPPVFDSSRYAGRYERVGVRYDVAAGDDSANLVGTRTDTGPFAYLSPDPVDHLTFQPVSDGLFVTRSNDDDLWQWVLFDEIAGAGSYLHFGGRATPKRE